MGRDRRGLQPPGGDAQVAWIRPLTTVKQIGELSERMARVETFDRDSLGPRNLRPARGGFLSLPPAGRERRRFDRPRAVVALERRRFRPSPRFDSVSDTRFRGPPAAVSASSPGLI